MLLLLLITFEIWQNICERDANYLSVSKQNKIYLVVSTIFSIFGKTIYYGICIKRRISEDDSK